MTNHPNSPDRGTEEGNLGPELAAALRALGLGVPHTVEEVAAAEAWLKKHGVALPASLLDLDGVFSGTKKKTLKLVPRDGESATFQNLARAAREGGEIPREVEERMKEDRERAERDGKNG